MISTQAINIFLPSKQTLKSKCSEAFSNLTDVQTKGSIEVALRLNSVLKIPSFPTCAIPSLLMTKHGRQRLTGVLSEIHWDRVSDVLVEIKDIQPIKSSKGGCIYHWPLPRFSSTLLSTMSLPPTCHHEKGLRGKNNEKRLTLFVITLIRIYMQPFFAPPLLEPRPLLGTFLEEQRWVLPSPHIPPATLMSSMVHLAECQL